MTWYAAPIWAPRFAATHTIPRELRAEKSYHPDRAAFASLAMPALLLLGSKSPEWAKEGTDIVHGQLEA